MYWRKKKHEILSVSFQMFNQLNILSLLDVGFCPTFPCRMQETQFSNIYRLPDAHSMLKIQLLIFNNINVGGQRRPFQSLIFCFPRSFNVAFDVCFGSLSWCNIQPLFHHFDFGTLAPRIRWYVAEILKSKLKTIKGYFFPLRT